MQFERPFAHIHSVDRKAVTAGLSSIACRILSSFALTAAGLYPEIAWPLLAELNLRGTRQYFPPGGSAADSTGSGGVRHSNRQREYYGCNPNPLPPKSSCNAPDCNLPVVADKENEMITNSKQSISADNVARLSPGTARSALPAGTDRPMFLPDAAHPDAMTKGPMTLRYVTRADRAYIAHELPKPVVRDVFGSIIDQEPASWIDWEGIAIGAFLVGFLILASTVLFKFAELGSASISQSAWRLLAGLQP